MANRQEQLAQLEAAAKERFLRSESEQEIKAFLKESGAYQRDVDRIYRNLKRETQKAFADEVEAQILAGQSLDDIKHELVGKVPSGLLESVITSGTQLAKRRVQQEVNQMVDEGRTMEEIAQRFTLPAIGIDELADWADARDAQNQEAGEEVESGKRNIIIGIVLILAGLGLTAGSYTTASSNGGSYTIWYGLMIIGAITMIQGFFSGR